MAAAALPGTAWPSFRDPALPFGRRADDRWHWRRIRLRAAAPLLLLALALPWLPRPPAERAAPAPAAPVARLLPQPEADTPPPARPPLQAEARTSAPVVVPEARRPQPQRPAGEKDPRQKMATGVGLLALKQQLAQIHGAPVAVQLQPPARPGPGVGSGEGPGVGAGTEPGLPLRALVTSHGRTGSGGVGTAAFSADSGGGGLPGRATTLVAGVAGGSGGGGPGGGGYGLPGARGAQAGGGGAAAGGGRSGGSSGKASRSIEDIKLVFDRHKGAIHALYNRALRDDPALQGKVVLELRIAPSGEVVDCRVLASELRAAELERKLVARVRLFDFGAKEVETMVVSWPVDFLPS